MRYVVIFLSLLCVAAIGHDVWTQHQLNAVNATVSAQLQEANLEIGRAHTMYGDAQKKIAELTSAQQADITNRHGKVTEFGQAAADLNTKGEGSVSSVPILNPNKDVRVLALDLEPGAVYQAVSRTDLQMVEAVPFEWKDFRLDIKGTVIPGTAHIETNVSYTLHMKIGATMAEVRLPDGTLTHYITLFEVGADGKTEDVMQLDKYEVIVTDQRVEQFYWWAPHMDVGLDAGLSEGKKLNYGGSVGFSAMGYGLTKNDLRWRFLRVGLNLSDRLGLEFTPFQYNVAEHLPLLSNLWLGPTLWRDSNNYTVGAFLGVQL